DPAGPVGTPEGGLGTILAASLTLVTDRQHAGRCPSTTAPCSLYIPGRFVTSHRRRPARYAGDGIAAARTGHAHHAAPKFSLPRSPGGHFWALESSRCVNPLFCFANTKGRGGVICEVDHGERDPPSARWLALPLCAGASAAAMVASPILLPRSLARST